MTTLLVTHMPEEDRFTGGAVLPPPCRYLALLRSSSPLPTSKWAVNPLS